MIAYLILALSALGCGALFPAPAGDSRNAIGIRFMAGVSVLILILFFGNVVLRVPLGTVAFAVPAIAAIGLVRLGLEIRAGRFSRACLLHPVPILLLMIGIVILARGGVDYLPWQWDEYSRWIYVTKLMFLTEEYWADTFRRANEGYTPGWRLWMVLPSLVLGRFSEGNLATAPFIMHVGLLGILYDISRRALERIETLSFGARTAGAWLVVLVLLLGEASWKLVPTLLASEKPQIYLLGACLAGVLYYVIESSRRSAIIGYVGLFMAAAYLVKVATLAFLPSLILFALFLLFFDQGADGGTENSRDRKSDWRRAWRRAFTGTRIKNAAMLLLPFLVVYATWIMVESPAGCFGDSTELLRGNRIKLFFSDAASDLAGRYFPALFTYVAHYKLPLTIIGTLGIAAGLLHRKTAVVALMLILFIAAYVFALYYFHLACFSDYFFETLISIPRFTRVWLRLVHVFGPLILFLMVVEWIARSRGPLVRFCKSRGVAFAGTGLAMLLLAWQAVQAASSFDAMATRADFRLKDGGRHYRIVKDIPAEATALKALLKRNGSIDPKVLLIAQGGTAFPLMVAKYHGAATKRDRPMYSYRLYPMVSWGEVKKNPLMRKSTRQQMLTLLRGHRVIWPFILDDWMREVLSAIIDDAACRAHPERYFLLRRSKQGTPYICVAKWPEKTPTV